MQVELGLKQLTCHLVGGGPLQHALEAFAEATALQIKGRKPIPKKLSRRSRAQPDVALLQQPLYIVDGSTGAMQARLHRVALLIYVMYFKMMHAVGNDQVPKLKTKVCFFVRG